LHACSHLPARRRRIRWSARLPPPLEHFDLSSYGITVKDVRRNLAPATLYAEAIREDEKCDISDTGALIAYSGDKTGRSPYFPTTFTSVT